LAVVGELFGTLDPEPQEELELVARFYYQALGAEIVDKDNLTLSVAKEYRGKL
jgi:hypothetical protein